MPDFSSLLRKPAGEASKPKALPIGDYPGKVKSFEFGDANKNHTPYVRLQLALTGWPDDVPDDERTNEKGEAIDLSKKSLRRDMFLTDDALWRLDELLKGLGIELAGRTYEEAIPETVGQDVLIAVEQYVGTQNNEIGNQVGAIKPLA